MTTIPPDQQDNSAADAPQDTSPREGQWAAPVDAINVSAVPDGAVNLNVEGKRPVSPLQGFGQLWQKTYRVRLAGSTATPQDVMQVWREHFPKFQPDINQFYPPMTGIRAGEVVFIQSRLPVLPNTPEFIPIASGVRVLYVDNTSFTIMTPQGFPEAGFNTFSTHDDNGVTVAQVQSLARAADPIWELGMMFMGGAQQQEATWRHVLKALAAHFGVTAEVDLVKVLVDPRWQWKEAKNIWYNASLRTMLYALTRPFRRATQQSTPPQPAAPTATMPAPTVPPPTSSAPAAPHAASPPGTPRNAASWAKPVDRLSIPDERGMPPINVEGRPVVGALQGFGQLWQKTYRVRLSGAAVQPMEVVRQWKQNFPKFWPPNNRFYGPLTGIAPGEVGVLDLAVGGGVRLSTGVMVIYADDEQFTFMTPAGHMFAGWITFGAFTEDSTTVAQIQALIRANDPMYEIVMRLGILHRMEDQFWHRTLENLAAYFGVNGQVFQQVSVIDPNVKWSKIGNIRYNAGVRTVLYQLTWPLRALRRALAKR